MLFEAIVIGILVGQYIYHRLTEEDPRKDNTVIPRATTGEGQAVPLVFGSVRVRTPFVVWSGNARTIDYTGAPTPMRLYQIDVLFAIGIPFFDGVTKLGNIWIGDRKAGYAPVPPPWGTTLGSAPSVIDNSVAVGQYSPMFVTFAADWDFFDGNSAGDMSIGSFLRQSMIEAGIPTTHIPGYRGYAMFHAYRMSCTSPEIPELNFELVSFPFNQLYGINYIPTKIGDDANPADVIASLLCDQFAKHGLDPDDWLDFPSFKKSAETLLSEGMGFSRAWDQRTPTRDMISEVLRYVDGVLYQNNTTGKVHFDLVRPDYDPNALDEINESNCTSLENLAAGGWTDTPNKYRVVFSDRSDNYNENSGSAQNMANAVGQDGEVIEKVARHPGCTTKDAANLVAARDLAADSRPVTKFRATVDRTFAGKFPGGVVRVTWPKENIIGRVFRIGRVNLGAKNANVVQLDLIEDAFFVHRRRVSHTPPVNPFPGGPILDPDGG